MKISKREKRKKTSETLSDFLQDHGAVLSVDEERAKGSQLCPVP